MLLLLSWQSFDEDADIGAGVVDPGRRGEEFTAHPSELPPMSALLSVLIAASTTLAPAPGPTAEPTCQPDPTTRSFVCASDIRAHRQQALEELDQPRPAGGMYRCERNLDESRTRCNPQW